VIRIGVFGGSGYAGGELLRYLLGHPEVELLFVTSRSSAGKRLGDVIPSLEPFTDLVFSDPESVALDDVDCVFLALEHNASQELVPALLERRPALKIIDLAGDFRADDPHGYEAYYGVKHKAPELVRRFVFGFVEAQRERLRGAQLVANPGCFAMSLLLGLWPLKKFGKLTGPVVVSAITGSSGAGAKLQDTTHHPHRATNVRAYKVLNHQHRLEVEHFLGRDGWRLLFVPHGGPFVRGIFATMVFPDLPAEELGRFYREAYANDPFVRVVKGSPELRLVQDTPLAIVGYEGSDDAAAGLVAIDNLAKGAATQAVQSLNLMFGLDERTGLWRPGGFV
jgi:LysW-gamma-L-alpha-aminoadipyl-6-phosphate/LysW-L-glutamyl-5-phosphate reductase